MNNWFLSYLTHVYIVQDYGVVMGRGGVYLNCFRMQPPMCLNKDDADYVVAVMDRVSKIQGNIV